MHKAPNKRWLNFTAKAVQEYFPHQQLISTHIPLVNEGPGLIPRTSRYRSQNHYDTQVSGLVGFAVSAEPVLNETYDLMAHISSTEPEIFCVG